MFSNMFLKEGDRGFLPSNFLPRLCQPRRRGNPESRALWKPTSLFTSSFLLHAGRRTYDPSSFDLAGAGYSKTGSPGRELPTTDQGESVCL